MARYFSALYILSLFPYQKRSG